MSADKRYSQQKVDKLKRKLEERDARIAGLEALIERQLNMLQRYDDTASQLASGNLPAPAARELSDAEYSRLIDLLDRAIARAETLTNDKRSLESNLERTLKLLDDALANQERLSRQLESGTVEVAQPAEERMPAFVESTLARYDSMLERSLAAMENAYRTSEERKRELDFRDKYLERTLKALDDALSLRESLQHAPASSFVDSSANAATEEHVKQTAITRYDEMLERSLAALEKAYQENENNKKQIAERDRLLTRTLDALDGLVENDAPTGTRSGFSRLFG